MPPKVSILWLNHNSMKFINIVLESLRSIEELDYPNYELVAVDNGSTDGSQEVVKKQIDAMRRKGIKARFIQLSRNLGFTGGNNIAYMARDPESKYIVLLNNDAVLYWHSLEALVDCLETNSDVGACNGIVARYSNPNLIDTYADYLDSSLQPYSPFQLFNCRIYDAKKPLWVTYPDGCCCIVRVEAVKRAVGDRLFPDEGFLYLDDTFLGLALWGAGYKCLAIPVVVARHRRSATTSETALFWGFRGFVAMNQFVETRRKLLNDLLRLKQAIYRALVQHNKLYLVAYRDGVEAGKRIAKKYRFTLLRAPHVEVPIAVYLKAFASRSIFAVERFSRQWLKQNVLSFKAFVAEGRW